MQPAAVTADPRRRPEPLQMRQRRRDGDIVSLQEPVVARQRPAHRHRLRRRERRIKPGHRVHHPPISSDAIDERVAEPCPRNRVTALQQGLQVVAPDRARQSETGCLAARTRPPAPRRARRSNSGCSTSPTPQPTTHGSSRPAASDPPPDRPHGHLSAETRSGRSESEVIHGRSQADGRGRASCSPTTAVGPAMTGTAGTRRVRGGLRRLAGAVPWLTIEDAVGNGEAVHGGVEPAVGLAPLGELDKACAAQRREGALRRVLGDAHPRRQLAHGAVNGPRVGARARWRRSEHLEGAPSRRSKRPSHLGRSGTDDQAAGRLTVSSQFHQPDGRRDRS